MKKFNIIEFLIPIYILIGMLEKITIFNNISYFISLFIQIYFIIKIFTSKEKINKNILILYFINLLLIATLGIYFYATGHQVINIINRIFPLISIFGLVIINSKNNLFNINTIIKKTMNYFKYVGIFIIIDSLIYYLFGTSLFPPVSYLGFRFSGPFFDSNFMAITYGLLLLFQLYYYKNKNIFYIAICIILLLLAQSWSTFIILTITLVMHKFIKFKSLFFKQLVFLVLDYTFIIVFVNNIDYIKNIFLSIIDNLGYSEAENYAKFLSLQNRITTQDLAIELSISNPLGHGPRTIVPYLGKDVHNSYVGFLFELGIMGFLLEIINVPRKLKYSKLKDVITTYIFLTALLINIHYMTIFVFVLIVIFNKDVNQYEERK